jgi:hypothetical protein
MLQKLCHKPHLERGTEGADLGALLRKELPPTRPPDLAARASSGAAALSRRDAASAAAANLGAMDTRGSCSGFSGF